MSLFDDLMVDTSSGDYSHILSAIEGFLKANTSCELFTQNLGDKKANLIAVFGKPTLLVSCHMDTVKPCKGWSVPPYQATEKDGKFFGLGAADTKGNLLALLQAVAKAEPKNLMLLFNVDEESGPQTGMHAFLKSEFASSLKHALVCEPTTLKLVNQHTGYSSFWIEVPGKAKHSSEADQDNAITTASRILLGLEKKAFMIGKIEGGLSGNMVPDSCKFKCSIRSYLAQAQIVSLIKEILAPYPGVAITESFVGPSLVPNTTFPYLDLPCEEAEFWTEASLLSLAGIPSVVLGAGNITQAHSADEFVEKSQLEAFEKMLIQLFGEFP